MEDTNKTPEDQEPIAIQTEEKKNSNLWKVLVALVVLIFTVWVLF
jgi:hypothetical protein